MYALFGTIQIKVTGVFVFILYFTKHQQKSHSLSTLPLFISLEPRVVVSALTEISHFSVLHFLFGSLTVSSQINNLDSETLFMLLL